MHASVRVSILGEGSCTVMLRMVLSQVNFLFTALFVCHRQLPALTVPLRPWYSRGTAADRAVPVASGFPVCFQLNLASLAWCLVNATSR